MTTTKRNTPQKMSSTKRVARYGLWQSDLDMTEVMDRGATPMYPFRWAGKLYWLQSLSERGGKLAMMCKSPGKQPRCITPEQYNIRSKVHEYGGCCFCRAGDFLVFNNFEDGSIYLQNLRDEQQITLIYDGSCSDGCVGFADLEATPEGEWIVAVMESSMDSQTNLNTIVAIPLQHYDHNSMELVILAEGADFYACPTLSIDAGQIAWMEWDLPYMPWDRTRLVCADLIQHDRAITASNKRLVVDQAQCSVCQPGFLSDGRLLYVSDSKHMDFWNFYQFHQGNSVLLTELQREFGEPHWVFGQKRWQQVDQEKILAVASCADGDQLTKIDLSNGLVEVVHQEFAGYSQLSRNSNELLFSASFTDKEPEIATMDVNSHEVTLLYPATGSTTGNIGDGVEHAANRQDAVQASIPKHIEYPTSQGETAYGYFYQPCNMKFEPTANALPPLMVMIHGGPTGRASMAYDGLKQYFCSLGFAVLDINHRGSSGYGRQFRQSLLGNWGEHDAKDIAAAVEYVIDKGWVQPDGIFIRGSSAGGYAVLRALTRYPDLFAGGACYYGIGNLITLSEITHKFESKYTDQLVGETFHAIRSRKPTSEFVKRSPVFDFDKLSSPLILFQGENDKVVPPSVSREVVELLKRKNIKYRYTEYPGEGHGFRKTETRVDALSREVEFFSQIIQSVEH